MTQLQTVPKVMKVQLNQIENAIDFAMRVRREVFPMMNHERLPVDLEQFKENYLDSADAVFLVAVMEDERIVGSIGILPYDGRIEAITGRYPAQSAAEIVKCYVDSEYRRYGIGSLLVRELEKMVAKLHYTTLYLHTHRFLPGAVDFWKGQGYVVVVEQDDDWQTVHMEKVARVEVDQYQAHRG
ncbi:GNAT family N-acetyltransferase [Paenibacillus xylanilyticus]|uniref:GNAT family N-acetyltransferase n=1 Tax=Paenibacillus xylanilyticus TaxID=248903 RepID=A0A7Y6EZD9_9BACL|nr:GNAT family N-acetyltransferase [Paenibacillus xylanilyticus]NUU79540.1 GNAT family N-acetyltransferase [Paenibacillus xylanilyticus]